MSRLRNQMLAKLHLTKKNQGLDDDTYRDKLEAVTGRRSAADCSDAELATALEAFHGKQKKHNSYTGLLKAFWIAAFNLGELQDGTDAALDAFVNRQTGKLRLQFLTPPEANKVTEALKAICARAGFAPRPSDKAGLEARKALLLAQWARLHQLGVAKVEGPFGLNGYVSRKYLSCSGALANLDKAQLDDCARDFGRQIRKAQALQKAPQP